MPEDIAFQIQLGIVLPKLKEKLTDSVLAIVEELACTISAGSMEQNSPFPLEEAKSIFLKDFEIFIDRSIMPSIKDRYFQSISQPEESNNVNNE